MKREDGLGRCEVKVRDAEHDLCEKQEHCKSFTEEAAHQFRALQLQLRRNEVFFIQMLIL